MNNQGEITTQWADGTYTFRLTVNGIIELEQKCDAPFAVIFGRLTSGAFALNDIRETLRIALIGGGKTPVEAMKLIERYALPLADSLPIAKAIMAGVMFGFEASPLGEAKAAPEASQPASTPRPSPEQQTSLESVLADWDSSVFGNSLPA